MANIHLRKLALSFNNAINGKKTVTGIIVSLIGIVMLMLELKGGEVVLYAGLSVTTGGGVHKIIKYNKNNNGG